MLRNIIRSIFLNSSRVHLSRLNKRFAESIPAGSIVLDAGAGEAPYRHLFMHVQYETADFEKVDKRYRESTYVCDLASIPVENERFDYIIFNQVMEHLPDPLRVLCELNRVLKTDGKILCTTPLFYEEHEKPYDYFRYTQFAHRYLFEASDFSIDTIDWLEGYFGTVAYQMKTAARYLPLAPSSISPGIAGYVLSPAVLVVKMFCALTSVVFYRLDIIAPYKGSGFPKNYAVIASKNALLGGPNSMLARVGVSSATVSMPVSETGLI